MSLIDLSRKHERFCVFYQKDTILVFNLDSSEEFYEDLENILREYSIENSVIVWNHNNNTVDLSKISMRYLKNIYRFYIGFNTKICIKLKKYG